MNKSDDWFQLDVDPKHIAKEREKARKLKKSQWWLSKLNQGLCHYCGGKFAATQLTMDHVVPIARGGMSSQGNIVPACKGCNAAKKLETPAETLLRKLEDPEKQ